MIVVLRMAGTIDAHPRRVHTAGTIDRVRPPRDTGSTDLTSHLQLQHRSVGRDRANTPVAGP